MPDTVSDRWARRPFATWAVRAVAWSLPVGAAFAVGVGVSRVVPVAGDLAGQVGRVALVLAASFAVYAVVGRGARRLLPLAMLLRLSLVFPDHAPSRLGMALRASNPRRLREWARAQSESGGARDAAQQAETVLTLIVALGAHDRRTRGHSERVQALTDLVGENLGLPEEARERLRWGALLHDIGKLSVPARVLNLPGRPNAAELRTLRRHPAEGARLADPLASWLGEWRHAIDQHHERYDGTGYPLGLAGVEISLAGRVVAVTDAFETMTAVRSYKKAMSMRDARAEVVASAGNHFDPKIVRSFLEISLGQLRWALGFAAAVAELPLVGLVPRAASVAANGLAAAPAAAGLGGAAIVGLGVITFPGTPAVTPHRAPNLVAPASAPAASTPPPAAPAATEAPATAIAPTVTTLSAAGGAAGAAVQGTVQSVSGTIGALGGLHNPLTLPGGALRVPLPLP